MLCNGVETLGLTYKANGAGDYPIDDAENLIEKLREMYRSQYTRHRHREMDMGATMTGPHKDDLIIALNDKEARSFGSEGQQRSCVAALRLAEWQQLQISSQETPIMLVDDIGLSLDVSRKKQLIDHFATLGQVFVTTTEEQI